MQAVVFAVPYITKYLILLLVMSNDSFTGPRPCVRGPPLDELLLWLVVGDTTLSLTHNWSTLVSEFSSGMEHQEPTAFGAAARGHT